MVAKIFVLHSNAKAPIICTTSHLPLFYGAYVQSEDASATWRDVPSNQAMMV